MTPVSLFFFGGKPADQFRCSCKIQNLWNPGTSHCKSWCLLFLWSHPLTRVVYEGKHSLILSDWLGVTASLASSSTQKAMETWTAGNQSQENHWSFLKNIQADDQGAGARWPRQTRSPKLQGRQQSICWSICLICWSIFKTNISRKNFFIPTNW